MRRERNGNEASVDLTPLLDVVFIMLVFFVVSASFLKETAIQANRSPSSDTTPNEAIPVPIRILAENTIVVDGREIDPRSLRANLVRLQAEKADAEFVIVASRRANTGTLVHVVGAARTAGIDDIPLAALRE